MALLENKKVRLNYEILETYPAGIELFGFEVKSLRASQGSLEGAHVTVRGSEAYLIAANIPAFQPKNAPKGYDPMRNRRLLLSKKELSHLAGMEAQRGLTIVPLSVYNKGKFLKVDVAIARGKKKFDKRESMKARDAKRDIERTLKRE